MSSTTPTHRCGCTSAGAGDGALGERAGVWELGAGSGGGLRGRADRVGHLFSSRRSHPLLSIPCACWAHCAVVTATVPPQCPVITVVPPDGRVRPDGKVPHTVGARRLQRDGLRVRPNGAVSELVAAEGPFVFIPSRLLKSPHTKACAVTTTSLAPTFSSARLTTAPAVPPDWPARPEPRTGRRKDAHNDRHGCGPGGDGARVPRPIRTGQNARHRAPGEPPHPGLVPRDLQRKHL